MGFGERLRSLRTKKKVTQKQFATMFKIADSTVSMYERGEREPAYEQLERFADYFGVTIDYLMGRTDDPSPTESITLNEDDPDVGRAFLGGAKSYTEEEIEIAKAAARAAVEAYRKGKQKSGK